MTEKDPAEARRDLFGVSLRKKSLLTKNERSHRREALFFD